MTQLHNNALMGLLMNNYYSYEKVCVDDSVLVYDVELEEYCIIYYKYNEQTEEYSLKGREPVTLEEYRELING